MPKINLLRSETPIRISELKADYDKDLLSTLANTSIRDIRNYLSFKLGEISNEAKALQYTIAMVCSAKFIEALQKYAITPEVEEDTFQSFLEEINQLLERRDTGSFHMDRFWKSELVQDYAQRLLALVADQIDEKPHTRIRVYMRDYCPLFFKELLSSETAIYNKLLKFLASPLHLAQQERYYREKYYTDLKHEYTSVTLNDPKGMTLDHVYQEPGFSVFNRCLTDRKRKELKGNENEERFLSSKELGVKEDVHAFTIQWLQRKFAHDDLEHDRTRILLLYGYPGQGKTSFCKRLVHDLLGEEVQEQPMYMLRFRNIERPELLKSEILKTVKDHLNERFKLLIEKEDLASSLLILDGLDELLMKNNLKTSDVDDIIRSLIYEIKLYPNLRIIVTSRHGYLNHKELKTSELLILSLDEFDLELQKSWLKAYLQFHKKCWLSQEKLKRFNEGKSYLKELLGQPILLHMVAALDEDITEDVPNRARVYELLFEQLTNPKKWKERQIDVLEGLDSEDLRQALREIAFHIFIGGNEYIHKSKIETLPEVRRLRGNLEKNGQNFREALKVMMVAFYFQEIPKDKEDIEDDNYDYGIEFLHKSLQEYLTAEYLWFCICEELLSVKRRGKYVLEQESDLLTFFQSIFGFRPLTKEIFRYLVEILQNDPQIAMKKQVRERMEEMFEYGLQKHFLAGFDQDIQNNAIELSAQIFFGYWSIYSNLTKKVKLVIGDSQKNTFVFMLKVLSNSTLPIKQIRLAFADLTGLDLRGITLDGADLEGAILENADLSFVSLRGANLQNANLCSAILTSAALTGANMDYADLSGANLRSAMLCGDLLYTKVFEHPHKLEEMLSKSIVKKSEQPSPVEFRTFSFPDNWEPIPGTAAVRTLLSSASIRNAILHNVDFKNADLEGAYLKGAKFNGAKNLTVEQVLYADTSFEGIEGLDENLMELIKELIYAHGLKDS